MTGSRLTAVIAGTLLGLLGLALVANGLWIPVKAELAQLLIKASWQRVQQGEDRSRPWPWADTWPVARLVAPRLDKDLYVLAGATGQSMAFGPAHVSSSSPPGGPDNIVLAGHRDTHFAFLQDLVEGDELVIETENGVDRYRVDGRRVVHESRTELLLPTGRAELTLITCFPFGRILPGGPLRYVISAGRT
ncbi:MAG: class GN sortase [Myxococcales bacterium]